MKLYYKDTNTQITGVRIDSARKIINTGGQMSGFYPDTELSAITTAQSMLLQPVEVRKNDGTTVLWEGVITRITYDATGFTFQGQEVLSLLDNPNCHYNALKAEGTVTSLADDYIMDTQLTTAAAMVGKYVGFTDTDVGGANEVVYYPNSNSDFFNGGVAAETETGDYEDLLTGGNTYMYLYDTTGKAKDYYGIELQYTVPIFATVSKVVISIDFHFQPRSSYTAGDEPLIELYDDNGAVWVTADNADTYGLGRLNPASATWCRTINTRYYHNVTIKSNIANYFNAGTNILKLRVTCGDTNTSKDSIIMYTANLLAKTFTTYTALSEGYIVDAVDVNKLTFTDQTPNADGIAVNDAYRMGEPLHTILAGVWLHAPVTLVDLTVTATTLFDAIDLTTTKVGTILRQYANRMGRIVFQAVGWEIKCITPLTDSGLALTHTNCKDWTISADGLTTARTVTSRVNDINHYVHAYNQGRYDWLVETDAEWALTFEQMAAQSGPLIYTLHEDTQIHATIRLDLDDGTDYSALDVGKTLTINFYAGQLTMTNATIKEVHYMQYGNGHLFANVVLEV